MLKLFTRNFAQGLEHKLLFGSEWRLSSSNQKYDVLNPATQEVVGKVPEMTQSEFNQIVQESKNAQTQWAQVPVFQRVRLLGNYLQLIRENSAKIGELVVLENGKTIADAQGELQRGIEILEFTLGSSQLCKGETLNNVSKHMDIYTYKYPIGVTAGIVAFNFPVMLPLWTASIALACGNSQIVKPSEKTPSAPEWLVELGLKAGFPPGLLSIAHGYGDVVDKIIEHPDIAAISFIGANRAGEYIYSKASALGKRVISNMGAKNHMILMPDANKQDAVNAIIGASLGAAGQRCMAITVVVTVGQSKEWITEIVEGARNLKVGPGNSSSTDIGPLITKQSKERVEQLIQSGIDQGAQLLLDGRGVQVQGYENGNFVGPTIFRGVSVDHDIYKEEIFGPVLCIVEVDTYEEALKIVNDNQYGNGVSIFTSNGSIARNFYEDCEVGQVGVNIPIPVPLSPFSFTGLKKSCWGSSRLNGTQVYDFYQKVKTITQRWKPLDGEALQMSTAFPTNKWQAG